MVDYAVDCDRSPDSNIPEARTLTFVSNAFTTGYLGTPTSSGEAPPTRKIRGMDLPPQPNEIN